MAGPGEVDGRAAATFAAWTAGRGSHGPGRGARPDRGDRRTHDHHDVTRDPDAESTRPPSGRCGRSATTTGSPRRPSGSSGRCSSGPAGSPPGQRVLDVAAGTGNVAIRAAEAGREVVAPDLTPENFEAGAARRARGVELEWVEADAEALPFGDGEFDVVTSSFGAMFAPDHQDGGRRAAARLPARRHDRHDQLHARGPRGRVLRDASAATRRRLRPGALPPMLWGSEEHVRELFGDRVDRSR